MHGPLSPCTYVCCVWLTHTPMAMCTVSRWLWPRDGDHCYCLVLQRPPVATTREQELIRTRAWVAHTLLPLMHILPTTGDQAAVIWLLLKSCLQVPQPTTTRAALTHAQTSKMCLAMTLSVFSCNLSLVNVRWTHFLCHGLNVAINCVNTSRCTDIPNISVLVTSKGS